MNGWNDAALGMAIHVSRYACEAAGM
jgi:hypothetical protein